MYVFCLATSLTAIRPCDDYQFGPIELAAMTTHTPRNPGTTCTHAGSRLDLDSLEFEKWGQVLQHDFANLTLLTSLRHGWISFSQTRCISQKKKLLE
jgi:hypothetical protein